MSAIPPDEEAAPGNGNGTGVEPTEGPRSVSALVNELVGEVRALTRAEMALARSEMHDQMQALRQGAISMATGSAVMAAGLLAVVAAAVLLLDRFWPAWVAALVVGVVLACVGGAMLALGKRRAKQYGLRPTRTINSLSETRTFARHHAASATRKWR